MIRLAAWAVQALGVAAVVWLLREAAGLLVPVLSALILALVLSPAVRALRRRGVPEALGAGLLVLALVSCVLPVAVLMVEPALQWAEQAPRVVSRWVEQIDQLRQLRQRPAAPSALSGLNEQLARASAALPGQLAAGCAQFALSGAAVAMLLYFLLGAEHWLLPRCLAALPRPRQRALLLGGLRAVQRDISRFVGALAQVNLGVAVVLALVFAALGLPNPLLWGLLVGLLNFIPYLGPVIITGLLLSTGALHFTGLVAPLLPAAAFLVVHAIESNLICPWRVGRGLAMNPLSVFASVLLWGWLWGIAGAVLAVPLLIALRSVCRRTRRGRPIARFLAPAPGGADLPR